MKTLNITQEQQKYLNAKPEIKVVFPDGSYVIVNASGTIVGVVDVVGSGKFVKGENVNMEVKP